MLMSGSPTADIQVGAFFAVGSARQAAVMAARGPPVGNLWGARGALVGLPRDTWVF